MKTFGCFCAYNEAVEEGNVRSDYQMSRDNEVRLDGNDCMGGIAGSEQFSVDVSDESDVIMRNGDATEEDHENCIMNTFAKFGLHLETQLGQGGLGTVVRAIICDTEDFLDGQVSANHVAVKIVRKDPRILKEIEAEAQLHGRLSKHEHLVTFSRSFQAEFCVYIVMECMNGTDLASFVENNGNIGEVGALKVMRQVFFWHRKYPESRCCSRSPQTRERHPTQRPFPKKVV